MRMGSASGKPFERIVPRSDARVLTITVACVFATCGRPDVHFDKMGAKSAKTGVQRRRLRSRYFLPTAHSASYVRK
jgi:hypothetical protein